MGNLFEKLELKFSKSNFDKNNDVSRVRNKEFSLPLVNAKNGDNGIMYFGRKEDFQSAEMTIDIVNDGAVSTGNVYSQPQLTGVLYNAYLIKSKFEVSEKLLHFFTSSIHKSIKLKYGYENKAGWEKIQKEEIQLPTIDGKIDFEFMESFIAGLEAERIAQLKVYLLAAGLKDYELTEDELKAIEEFQEEEFSLFNVTDIFDVKNTGNILGRDVVENSGIIPYLCASRENNAVSSYISYDESFIDKGDCIFIGGKTFVVTYQKNDFFSNDSHNLILYLKDKNNKIKLNQLFLSTCINKSLGYKYSWGDSISYKKIQTDVVSLPTQNHKPNYAAMEILISAVQKLVIKDVVNYVDKKIKASKTVVNKSIIE